MESEKDKFKNTPVCYVVIREKNTNAVQYTRIYTAEDKHMAASSR